MRPGTRPAPGKFALWSPHRESREVIAFRALLDVRSEPWHWVEHAEEAQWIVVEATRGISADWTRRVQSGAQVGIALAPRWSDVPDPAWRYLPLPLHPSTAIRWIETQLSFPSDRVSDAGPAPVRWEGQQLKLSSWPNLARYGEASMSLTIACGQMLRGPVRFESLRVPERDRPALNQLLQDAFAQGRLITLAGGSSGKAATVEPAGTRWNLLQRIARRMGLGGSA